jgi:hypothetical protein
MAKICELTQKQRIENLLYLNYFLPSRRASRQASRADSGAIDPIGLLDAKAVGGISCQLGPRVHLGCALPFGLRAYGGIVV